MTQEEVAELAGISLRSYKSYENEPQKKGTPIYRYILELLQKKAFVDEEHGILTLNFITDRCREVLSQYDVEYCYLFGSYSRAEAKETSDVDLLVSTSVTGMDFYGMAERLRVLILSSPVTFRSEPDCLRPRLLKAHSLMPSTTCSTTRSTSLILPRSVSQPSITTVA